MNMNRRSAAKRRLTHWAVALLLIVIFPAHARSDVKTKPVKVNHVTVQAFADREAIVPGETFHLAVSLKMDKKWHIYWRGPGNTGLPTTINWTVPDGYEAGRTLFPIPEAKYNKTLKETSYIHQDTAVFLTPIRVPASAKMDGQVELKAEVSWLACKRNCIPGDAEVSLSLPVVSAGTEPKPANEKLFEEARDALPTSGQDAKRIKLSGSAGQKTVKPGDKFTATLKVEIAAKHHMQSNKPLSEGLIPAFLFLEQTDGLETGEVEYPKPHIRKDKILGKLSEYEGKVAFKIPVEVDEDTDKKPRWIRGLLQYQICSDAGTCFPPEYVTWEIPIRMDGGPPPTKSQTQQTQAAAVGDLKPAEKSATDITAGAPATTDNIAASTSSWTDKLDKFQQWFIEKGYYGVLVLAFLGGVILNLMPCVLPVISLKILSFVKQANEDRRRIFVLGLAYCTGIMVFFGVIAWLFYYYGTGWGELFQRPVVILILAAVVMAFSLSLFGVFAVFTPKVINQLGQKAEEREGMPSAFFTGVLATFLGTACTAPFLSAAVGTASKFPPGQGAGIFLAVGFGMMFPFLILSANPGWLRFVPKPGRWMGTFEAVMGFLLLGTVVWLLNPIRGQIGDWGMLLTLIFLLGVCIAAWLRGKAQFSQSIGRKYLLNVVSIASLALAWLLPFQWMSTIEKLEEHESRYDYFLKQGIITEIKNSAEDGELFWPPPFAKKDELFWVPYDQELVKQFVEGGYTVFVDFTADWCASCKANLKSSIEIDSTEKLMTKLNVVPFEADYTRRDAAMKKILASYDRAGVPLYLVFSPNRPDNPEILPELLTPGIVHNALRKAGPSKPGRDAMATAHPTPEVRNETQMARQE